MFRSSSPPLHIEHRLFHIQIWYFSINRNSQYALNSWTLRKQIANIYIYHYANDRSWLYIRKFTTFWNNKYLSNLNSHQFTFKKCGKAAKRTMMRRIKKKTHSTTTRKSKINKMRFSYLKIIKKHSVSKFEQVLKTCVLFQSGNSM